jgi:hypothetical protein
MEPIQAKKSGKPLHHQSVDHLVYALLSGLCVLLLALNLMPQAPLRFLYSTKVIASAPRFVLLESACEANKKRTYETQKSQNPSSSVVIRHIKKLESPSIQDKANQNRWHQSFSNHLFANLTVETTRFRDTKSLDEELRQFSNPGTTSVEVKSLENQHRITQWKLTASEHLLQELNRRTSVEQEDTSGTYKEVSTSWNITKPNASPLVSTQVVDDSTESREIWTSQIEVLREIQADLESRIESATKKAVGFLAIVGKPNILIRPANGSLLNIVIAFVAGIVTTIAVYIMIQMSLSQSAQRTSRSFVKQTVTPEIETSLIAKHLKGLGIPFLGSISLSEAILATASSVAPSTNNVREPTATASDPPSTAAASIAWIKLLKMIVDLSIVGWIAIFAMRFFLDERWREFFLASPLYGLCRMCFGLDIG